MDKDTLQGIIEATHWTRYMVTAVLGVLALFLLVGTAIELKQYGLVGSGVTATNTISVDGTGDVYAVPDTATFSVTVDEKAKDVKTAQDAATKKSNAIVAYLKQQKIDEKDIQTTDYNIQPNYEWQQAACPMNATVPCPSGRQVLIGYEVSQTLSVKVRDTTKAGDILAGVGGLGASQVSGLAFTIDSEDAVKAQARDKAIAQAKTKAQVLAKSLGVSLVRIVGFSENTNGNVMRVYSAKSDMMSSGAGIAPMAAPAPDIQTGQNKITSNVSVTYEVQ